MTWVCNECGCDVAGYGVCRCVDDEMWCFCAECAKEYHDMCLGETKTKIQKQLEELEALEALDDLISRHEKGEPFPWEHEKERG